MLDVKPGDTLYSDVYCGDTLLVRSGTVVTEQLLVTLGRFGVSVTPDKPKLEFDCFTNAMRLNLLRLDLDEVVYCAEQLVDSLCGGTYNGMLHLVYDYDNCTYLHSRNVTLLALLAGIELQYDLRDLRTMAVGALLHDIGKLQVPLEILDKPGKLTREEFAVVKQHPQFGYTMLDDLNGLSAAVKQIVLQHHENYDGSGYPRAIDTNHGYRLARLIHICDVYEAMCAKRPYKEQLPRDYVREFLCEKSGSMFDPTLVDKFLSAVPAYIVGEQLTYNGVNCVVVAESGSNPIVSIGDVQVRLHDIPA